MPDVEIRRRAVEDPGETLGIGRQLTEALAALAHERGCYGRWVGTEPDNVAALATYRAAGATSSSQVVVLIRAFAAAEDTGLTRAGVGIQRRRTDTRPWLGGPRR